MRTFDAGTRAAVARGWADSCLSQHEYATQHGISPRALRLWIKRHASRQPPLHQAKVIIAEAVAQLHDLLASISGSDTEEACRLDGRAPAYPSSEVAPPDSPTAGRAADPLKASQPSLDQALAGIDPARPQRDLSVLGAPEPQDSEVRRPKRGSFFAVLQEG